MLVWYSGVQFANDSIRLAHPKQFFELECTINMLSQNSDFLKANQFGKEIDLNCE